MNAVFASPANACGPVMTIVRFTVLDAMRGRWLWMIAAVSAIGTAAAVFAGELALTERAAVMTVALAPLVRLAAVLMVAAIVVAATVREVAERSMLLALAAPLSRSHWVAGKAIGFMTLAALTGLACALPVCLSVPAEIRVAASAWTGSLMLELMLVAGFALMSASAFKQVPAAVLATLAFYCLSRLIGTIALLSERSPLGEHRVLEGAGSAMVQALSAVLPRLDLFTQTEWLLGGAPPALAAVALQTALYCALQFIVTAIDLRGKDV